MVITLKQVSENLDDYLQSSRYIDWKHPAVKAKADTLKSQSFDEIGLIENAYHFVRDDIHHSWDVQDSRVTAKASDVLAEGVGVCWAKSNLLAALLRANGIPAGICYQRLTFGKNPESGYCIHALNAVYIQRLQQWIRLDARGNKKGIDAQFSLGKEKLAFPIRTECGEMDYPEIYTEPAEITMQVLENSRDALFMYQHNLPDRL